MKKIIRFSRSKRSTELSLLETFYLNLSLVKLDRERKAEKLVARNNFNAA